MTFLLGVDDTDSQFGHCTTHLGYLVVTELARLGCDIPTYPRLVRLNPNIPFKTRGNAAVCIEFDASARLCAEAFKRARALIRGNADVEHGANAAMVLAPKDREEELGYFRHLYQRAICGMVNYRSVVRVLTGMGVRLELLGNGMGIVGAAASLGFLPDDRDDHTYELITYRKPGNCGRPRNVEARSVEQMELETFPRTFNSFDHESGRVLIAPTGPDPVLAGVRGDSPQSVRDAFRKVSLGEEPLGYVIYVTNQCTDAHLANRLSTPLSAYSAGWLEGEVVSVNPARGGHLGIQLALGGSAVTCMVYEPSGDLRRVAGLLVPGDRIRLSGGVRRATTKNPAALNVERIEVLSVASGRSRSMATMNPRCASCGSAMKSEGRNKGYQCKRCGSKRPEVARLERRKRRAERRVELGTYLPSPRAQRHLTKQLIRYGREQVGQQPLIDGWLMAPLEPEISSLTPVPRPEKLKIGIGSDAPRR